MLKWENVNCVAVEWKKGVKTPTYAQAANNARVVAAQTVSMITFIMVNATSTRRERATSALNASPERSTGHVTLLSYMCSPSQTHNWRRRGCSQTHGGRRTEWSDFILPGVVCPQQDLYKQKADKFHLIGHGLGAHAAGDVGSRIGGLARISGDADVPLRNERQT